LICGSGKVIQISETSSGTQTRGTQYGSIARVAEGAEETRLIDGEDGDEEEDVYGSR